MRALKPAQIIAKSGHPEWAVIPYKDYLYFKELQELVQEVKQFKQTLSDGKEELIPEAFAKRLVRGEHPIKVWRQYRKLTQAKLAKQVEISIPYLSQIENKERTPSTVVFRKIAKALKVSVSDLMD